MKRWRKRSDSSTQSGPNQNAAKKDKIDPRWKVRIQAIVLIGLMVIPGNLGTLIIYFTSEGFFKKDFNLSYLKLENFLCRESN